MKTLFAVLFAAVSVLADPADLADDFTHAKLAVFHHVGLVEGTGASAPTLRFVHLVPKVDHLSHFADGVGCHHAGNALKHHKFLHLDGGEKLVELLGLSDCHKWHGSLLGVWSANAGHLVHKHYAGVKGEDVKVLGGLDALVEFFNTHLDLDHLRLFKKLLGKGLTAHLFTHKLHAKLEGRLAHS